MNKLETFKFSISLSSNKILFKTGGLNVRRAIIFFLKTSAFDTHYFLEIYFCQKSIVFLSLDNHAGSLIF